MYEHTSVDTSFNRARQSTVLGSDGLKKELDSTHSLAYCHPLLFTGTQMLEFESGYFNCRNSRVTPNTCLVVRRMQIAAILLLLIIVSFDLNENETMERNVEIHVRTYTHELLTDFKKRIELKCVPSFRVCVCVCVYGTRRRRRFA